MSPLTVQPVHIWDDKHSFQFLFHAFRHHPRLHMHTDLLRHGLLEYSQRNESRL